MVDGVNITTTLTPQEEANQTVRLDLGTKNGVKSIRIGFTDQRLTAHGGLAVWSRYVTEAGLLADRPFCHERSVSDKP